MEHVLLHCLNHPFLYWFTKDIAVSESGHYNGCRNIFFAGAKPSELPPDLDPPIVRTGEGCKLIYECSCPASDLRRCDIPTIPGNVTHGISVVIYSTKPQQA
jgi:hypothetical protein